MRILSLDGGGYLGLATAAFIEGLEHHFGTTASEQFDFFCGTSTGAFIALALASGKTGSEVRKLYERFGSEVLRPTWYNRALSRVPVCGDIIATLFGPKYSQGPLAAVLSDAFGELTLRDLRGRGKCVLITSFCVTAGTPRLFKTDHSKNLTQHGNYRLCDIALASSAAPIYFPLVRLTNPIQNFEETFCDGGTVANHPALLAFAEAVSELAVPPSQVQLLSISTPRANIAESSPPDIHRGLIGWGRRISSVFIDGGGLVSGHALQRLAGSYGPKGPVYQRIELRNLSNLAFDDASDNARRSLLQEGAHQSSSNDTRARVANFFSEDRD